MHKQEIQAELQNPIILLQISSSKSWNVDVIFYKIQIYKLKMILLLTNLANSSHSKIVTNRNHRNYNKQ
jgi:hypothetical protein